MIMLLTVLLAIPLYLLPGYIVLWMCNIRGMNQWTRLFFSLCISLVIVPVAFIFWGNFLHFIPGLVPYLILTAFLAVLGGILRLHKKRPVIRFPELDFPIAKLEKILAWAVIIFFTLITSLPGIGMFLQGDKTLTISPYDSVWHLAFLVSVARTGIPPAHYFFPTLKLFYYYASWIYPSILGNLPFLHVPLVRALVLHAFIQTFAFLGLIYFFLSYNFKRWWVRLMGLSFFTFMGGFDLFAGLPAMKYEAWQSTVGWLISNLQIAQFSTWYEWVPQHVAGGMAFLLGLLLIKNLKMSPVVRSAALGFLLSFCFLSSTFVFVS